MRYAQNRVGEIILLYAEEQVRAGIARLDEAQRNGENWREHVNWDILDMRDEYLCVLGQVYGDYSDGAEVLGLRMKGVKSSSFGFYRCDGLWFPTPEHEFVGMPEGDDPNNWQLRYMRLTETWKTIMQPVTV